MASPYNAFTEPQPGLYRFTGDGVAPVTLTGPTAQAFAAGLPPPQSVSAPLAKNDSIMTEAPPPGPAMTIAPRVERSVADVAPDMMGATSGGMSPAAAPVTVDPSLEVSRAPAQMAPAGYTAAPREDVVSRIPEASYASDGPAHQPTRRIGPGAGGGGAGPVDPSGGFLGASNMLAARLLSQRGGGSAGTKADAWQGQSRQTQVTDGRVGAIPMSGYLGAVGSEGSANEKVRQETEGLESQKLAKEAEIEAQAQADIEARQREMVLRRRDLRSSMEQIVNEADAPDIDPGAWWGSKTTGQAILLGLSSAFVGAASAKAGMANPVIASIDRAVEKDISAQIQNKDAKDRNKAAKLGRLGQLYAMVKEETGDDVQAMNQAKLTALTVAQKHLQATALQSDSPLAQQRADAAYAAIDRRKAEIVIENEKHLQLQKTGTEKFIPKGTGAGGGLTLKQQLEIAKGQAQLNKEFNPTAKPGESRGTASIGETSFKLDPNIGEAEAGVVRRTAVALDQGMKAAADVKKLRGTGLAANDPDVIHAIDRMAYSDALVTGQGQANKDQVEAAQNKWRGIFKEKGVDYAIETFEADAAAFRKQYGAK